MPFFACSVRYWASSPGRIVDGLHSVAGQALSHHTKNDSKCASYLVGYPFLASSQRFLNTSFEIPWRAPCRQINNTLREATSSAKLELPADPSPTTLGSGEGLGVSSSSIASSGTTSAPSTEAELRLNNGSNRQLTFGVPFPAVWGEGKHTGLRGSTNCAGMRRHPELDDRNGK